jgi:hypothetical protein
MRELVKRATPFNTVLNSSFAIVLAVFVTFDFQCGTQNHSEINVLLDMPMKQQEETFKQFSLEKQVDVYIEAMYVEPPQTRYASYLGSNGKNVLPFLAKRLEQEKSDTAKAYIVFAFKVIHEKYYSLSEEGQLLESIRAAIRLMKDGYRKQESNEYLSDILASPGFH